MSVVLGHQWGQAAQNERRELQQALTYNEQLYAIHAQRRQEIVAQANHAMAELTAALLPTLDRASLESAAHITGYSPLVQYDHVAQLEQDKARLAERIAKTEQDPDFAHGEHRWNTLQTELVELQQARRSLAGTLAAGDHPRMNHLLEVGYGTDDYKVPFWRLSYYSDWEAGDQILEQWPGKTFAEVRSELSRAREADKDLDDRIAVLQRQMSAIRGLADQHQRDKGALETAESNHLGRVRAGLARFIADTGAEALGPRFARAPAFDLMAKRVFGLAAKITYVDGLASSQLLKQREEIQTSMSRADREILKFSRPKKYNMPIPAETFQRRFRPRQARYQKTWTRFQTGYDRVYVFDRYDRADMASDFLWWDLMTDGELDGDFIPDVHHYHQRHPGYHYVRRDWDDDEPADTAAAAFLDEPDEPAGAAFDPS